MQVDRMSRMIQGILSLSSITPEVDFKRVDLEEIAKQAMSDLELKIIEKKATVKVGRLPAVTGNREYLIQLFYNLLSNAIKFSKVEPKVKITGEQNGNKVMIAVKDNGIGMPASETKRIFNAFERLHSRTEFEGSGIGLSICKRIVEIHHGEITVESEVGKGTTFIIMLPV